MINCFRVSFIATILSTPRVELEKILSTGQAFRPCSLPPPGVPLTRSILCSPSIFGSPVFSGIFSLMIYCPLFPVFLIYSNFFDCDLVRLLEFPCSQFRLLRVSLSPFPHFPTVPLFGVSIVFFPSPRSFFLLNRYLQACSPPLRQSRVLKYRFSFFSVLFLLTQHITFPFFSLSTRTFSLTSHFDSLYPRLVKKGYAQISPLVDFLPPFSFSIPSSSLKFLSPPF